MNKGRLKKITVRIISLLAAVALSATALGCGGETSSGKEKIIVKVFNGGAGTQWIENVKDNFNANNDTYEINLAYEKMFASTIESEIEMGTPTADCYFTSDAAFQKGIYRDYFEDLSDLLTRKPDGESGKTLQKKMLRFDDWKQLSSKNGEGMYMLPYLDAIMGLVYDHDMFVEKGWLSFADRTDKAALDEQGVSYTEKTEYGSTYLVCSEAFGNYEKDDKLLKTGKDGKFGTYDDGQPETESEFDAMISRMCNGTDQAKSFIYSGIHDYYVNELAHAMMAQYMGEYAFRMAIAYDSDGQNLLMHDKTQVALDFETNGYLVVKTEEAYQALRVLDKDFDSEYIHADCKKTSSVSHTDAQNTFLMELNKVATGNNTGYPAMLVEGSWWENEAKTMISSIGTRNPERGPGKVDYRFMLMPDIEGQYGLDTGESRTFFSTLDAGGIVVVKQEDENKLEAIKDFLLMTVSDEVLRNFTVDTGIVRPYEYDLSEQELSKMTPFGRNNWEIFRDTENIGIIRYPILRNKEPVVFASSIDSYFIYMESNGVYSQSYIRALRNAGSVDSAWNSVGYSQEEWSEFVQDAIEQGFYSQE